MYNLFSGKKTNEAVAVKRSCPDEPAETLSPATVHNSTSQSFSKFEAVKKSVRPVSKPKALDTQEIKRNKETQSAQTPRKHEVTSKHIKSRPGNKILTKPTETATESLKGRPVTESLKGRPVTESPKGRPVTESRKGKPVAYNDRISTVVNPEVRVAEEGFQPYSQIDNSRSGMSQEDAKHCESIKSPYKARSTSVPVVFSPSDTATPTPPQSISKGSRLSYTGLFH